MKKLDIFLDLDNTISTSIRKNHPEDILKVKPRKKWLKIINELNKRGHKITIFTRRNACGKNGRKLTIQWLQKWEIPYTSLISKKPHYDIFIGDRLMSSHQSNINADLIEAKAKFIWEDIKKHTYKPKNKK